MAVFSSSTPQDKASVNYIAQMNWDIANLNEEDFRAKYNYTLTHPNNTAALEATNRYYKEKADALTRQNELRERQNYADQLRKLVATNLTDKDGKFIEPTDARTIQTIAGLAFRSAGLSPSDAMSEDMQENLFGVRGIANVANVVAKNTFDARQSSMEKRHEWFTADIDKRTQMANKALYGDRTELYQKSFTDGEYKRAMHKDQSKNAFLSALETNMSTRAATAAHLLTNDELSRDQKTAILSNLSAEEQNQAFNYAEANRALNDDLFAWQNIQLLGSAIYDYAQVKTDHAENAITDGWRTDYVNANKAARLEGFKSGRDFLKNATVEQLKKYNFTDRDASLSSYVNYERWYLNARARQKAASLSHIKPREEGGAWGTIKSWAYDATQSVPQMAVGIGTFAAVSALTGGNIFAGAAASALVTGADEALNFYEQAIEEDWQEGSSGEILAAASIYGTASGLIETVLGGGIASASKPARAFLQKSVQKAAGKRIATAMFGSAHLTNAQLLAKKSQAKSVARRILTVATQNKRALLTETLSEGLVEEPLQAAAQSGLSWIIDPTSAEGKKLYGIERFTDDVIEAAWAGLKTAPFLILPMHTAGNLRGSRIRTSNETGKQTQSLFFATQQAINKAAFADSINFARQNGITESDIETFLTLPEGSARANSIQKLRDDGKGKQADAFELIDEYAKLVKKDIESALPPPPSENEDTGTPPPPPDSGSNETSGKSFFGINIPEPATVRFALLNEGYSEEDLDALSENDQAALWLASELESPTTEHEVALNAWFIVRFPDKNVNGMTHAEKLRVFKNTESGESLFGEPANKEEPASEEKEEEDNESWDENNEENEEDDGDDDGNEPSPRANDDKRENKPTEETDERTDEEEKESDDEPNVDEILDNEGISGEETSEETNEETTEKPDEPISEPPPPSQEQTDKGEQKKREKEENRRREQNTKPAEETSEETTEETSEEKPQEKPSAPEETSEENTEETTDETKGGRPTLTPEEYAEWVIANDLRELENYANSPGTSSGERFLKKIADIFLGVEVSLKNIGLPDRVAFSLRPEAEAILEAGNEDKFIKETPLETTAYDTHAAMLIALHKATPRAIAYYAKLLLTQEQIDTNISKKQLLEYSIAEVAKQEEAEIKARNEALAKIPVSAVKKYIRLDKKRDEIGGQQERLASRMMEIQAEFGQESTEYFKADEEYRRLQKQDDELKYKQYDLEQKYPGIDEVAFKNLNNPNYGKNEGDTDATDATDEGTEEETDEGTGEGTDTGTDTVMPPPDPANPVEPTRTQAAPTINEVESTAENTSPDHEETPQEAFAKKFREKINDFLNDPEAEKSGIGIVQLRKLAEECGWTEAEDADLQEAVELELVLITRNLAKNFANENPAERAKTRSAILKLYKLQPTISQRTTQRVKLQQYSTPLPLAAEMGGWLGVSADGKILEPTAGNGALTVALPAGNVHVNEIDPTRLANLEKQGFGRVTSQDATTAEFDGSYEAVISNPPFGNAKTIRVDNYPISGLEHQIAINALNAMQENGRAAIVIGGNTEYDKHGVLSLAKDRSFLSYLYSHFNVVDVINIDGKLYAKQGTTYPIRVILIDGKKAFDPKSYPPRQKDANAEKLSTWEEVYERFDSTRPERRSKKPFNIKDHILVGTSPNSPLVQGNKPTSTETTTTPPTVATTQAGTENTTAEPAYKNIEEYKRQDEVGKRLIDSDYKKSSEFIEKTDSAKRTALTGTLLTYEDFIPGDVPTMFGISIDGVVMDEGSAGVLVPRTIRVPRVYFDIESMLRRANPNLSGYNISILLNEIAETYNVTLKAHTAPGVLFGGKGDVYFSTIDSALKFYDWLKQTHPELLKHSVKTTSTEGTPEETSEAPAKNTTEGTTEATTETTEKPAAKTSEETTPATTETTTPAVPAVETQPAQEEREETKTLESFLQSISDAKTRGRVKKALSKEFRYPWGIGTRAKNIERIIKNDGVFYYEASRTVNSKEQFVYSVEITAKDTKENWLFSITRAEFDYARYLRSENVLDNKKDAERYCRYKNLPLKYGSDIDRIEKALKNHLNFYAKELGISAKDVEAELVELRELLQNPPTDPKEQVKAWLSSRLENKTEPSTTTTDTEQPATEEPVAEPAPAEPPTQKQVDTAITEAANPTAENPAAPRAPVPVSVEKVAYPAKSHATQIGSVVPVGMAKPIEENLSEIGDTDAFLMTELGYKTKEELYKALAAEQIDGVALAIRQLKENGAFINGDMTGVGKGRQAAAIIRWAVLHGKRPVFFTEKAKLFSDIWRDLNDIGSGHLRPYIINDEEGSAGKEARITDKNGNEIFKPTPKSVKEKAIKEKKLPDGYDFVISTYSQFNSAYETFLQLNPRTGKYVKKRTGELLPKAAFLAKISAGTPVILDEAHNTAGDSNTGDFFLEVVQGAGCAAYFSATFAKRPENIPVYAPKSSLGALQDDARKAISEKELKGERGQQIDPLVVLMKRGGVPLQEFFSQGLAAAGEMVRRERDFTGVTVDWLPMEGDSKVIREKYDAVTDIFRDIVKFQDIYVEEVLIKDVEENGDPSVRSFNERRKALGVKNSPFSSRLFLMTQQLLLSLKANYVADKAIAHVKAGRKPVITLQNTMEGILTETFGAPKKGRKKKGEQDTEDGAIEITSADFSEVLLRGLYSTMEYQKKGPTGVVEKVPVKFEDLSPTGQKVFRALEKRIQTFSAGLPLSPIDAIEERLEAAGLRVGELTGRDTRMVKQPNGNYKIVRATKEQGDHKAIIRGFQNGSVDVVILNQSASTGVSLHADKRATDQRPRVMIVAQAQLDVNTEVQTRGRIDRTGQVHRGAYEYIVSNIPAETRMMIMLKNKLKSLDANTTSSQKSSFNDISVVDFINKYGDEVVVDYIKENPEFAETIYGIVQIDNALQSDAGIASLETWEGAALVVSGRVAMLPVEEQEQFYNDIAERYKALIEYKTETGQNDIEMSFVPLNAKTLGKRVLIEGDDNEKSPLLHSAFIEECEVDVLKQPMDSRSIRQEIKKLNNGIVEGDAWRKAINAKVQSIIKNEIAQKEAAFDKKTAELRSEAEKMFAHDFDDLVRKGKADERYREDHIRNAMRNWDNSRAAIRERIPAKTKYNWIERSFSFLGRTSNPQNEKFVEMPSGKTAPGAVFTIPNSLKQIEVRSAKDGKVSKTIPAGRGIASAPAVFIGFKFPKSAKPNPSAIRAVFATLDTRSRVEIPLTQHLAFDAIITQTQYDFDQDYTVGELSSLNLDTWDSRRKVSQTERVNIITGNVARAMFDTTVLNDGTLIRFSRADGTQEMGIIATDKMVKSIETPLRPLADFWSTIVDRVQDGRAYTNAETGVALKGNPYTKEFVLWVPKAQKRIWESSVLCEMSLSKRGFTSRAGGMQASFKLDNPTIRDVISYLSVLGLKSRGITHSGSDITLAQRGQAGMETITREDTLRLRNLLGGWIAGVDVHVLSDEEFNEAYANANGGTASDFTGLNGQVFGFYNKETNQVYVRENSNISTIVHELGAHGTWAWARENEPALYGKLREAVKQAPESIKQQVRDRYGDTLSEEDFEQECFAVMWEADLMDATENLLTTTKEYSWWEKVKAFFTKLWQKCIRGFSGRTSDLNIGELSEMSPADAVAALQEAFIQGKRLGKIRQIETIRGANALANTMQKGVLSQRTIRPSVAEYEEKLDKHARTLASAMLRAGLRLNGRIDALGKDASMEVAKKLFPNASETLLTDAVETAREMAEPILTDRADNGRGLFKTAADGLETINTLYPKRGTRASSRPISVNERSANELHKQRIQRIANMRVEEQDRARIFSEREKALQEQGRRSKAKPLTMSKLAKEDILPFTPQTALVPRDGEYFANEVLDYIKKEYGTTPDALHCFRETMFKAFSDFANRRDVLQGVAVAIATLAERMRAQANSFEAVLQFSRQIEQFAQASTANLSTNALNTKIVRLLKQFSKYVPRKQEGQRKTEGWTDYLLHRCYRCIQFRDPAKEIEKRFKRESKILEEQYQNGTPDSPEANRARLAIRAYTLMQGYNTALNQQNLEELDKIATTLQEWLNGGDEALQRTLDKQQKEVSGFIDPLIDAMTETGGRDINKTRAEYKRSIRSILESSFTDGFSIKQRLMSLVRYCPDENIRARAEKAVRDMEYKIARARMEQNESYIAERNFLTRTLNSIFGEKGVNLNDEKAATLAYAKLNVEKPEFAKFSADGKTPLTTDELMGIYSMIRQEDVQRPFVKLTEEQKAKLPDDGKIMLRRIEQIKEIEKALGGKDGKCIRFINAFSEHYLQNADALDKVAVAVNGAPISMRTKDYNPVVRADQYRDRFVGAVSGGISPTPSTLTPRIINQHDIEEHAGFVPTFVSRAEDVAHFKAFGTMHILIANAFANRKFYESVSRVLGDDGADVMRQHFEDLLSVRLRGPKNKGALRVVRPLVKLGTITMLGGNFLPGLKQTTSTTSYANDVGFWKTMKALMSNPFSAEARESWKEIKESAGYKLRWNKDDIDIIDDLFKKHGAHVKNRSAMKFLMKAYRLGDRFPAWWVGNALYRASKRAMLGKINPDTGNLYTEAEAKKHALAMFFQQTDATQQAVNTENTSHHLRQGDAVSRAISQFRSAPAQYFAAEASAILDVMANPNRKESWKKFACVVINNHIIMPSLLWAVSQLGQLLFKGETPDEDDIDSLIAMMALGGFAGWFIIGYVAEGVLTSDAVRDMSMPIVSGLYRVGRGLKKTAVGAAEGDMKQVQKGVRTTVSSVSALNQVANVYSTYLADEKPHGRKLK